MICFADSSAVVKLYAGEEGADAVRDLSGIAVAQIARVEVTPCRRSRELRDLRSPKFAVTERGNSSVVVL
ncbi:MAG: hypothetical protein ACRDZQ_14060, partial [Acidimicrobiales bacterium]